jgi:ankyrin repeat protein
MSEQTPGSGDASSSPLTLPEAPSLEWLRKQAKRRLAELRASNPEAKLAEAQFDLAKRYGFASWRVLKAHVDSLTLDGQLFDAARRGDLELLERLLGERPDKLHVRDQPYRWTLLHAAAHKGQLAVVDVLLRRGLDPNTREKGDDTYAMHWAAAAGAVDVVRRLADAGGDVIGHGDDHELEVIGWATCWDGCDDDAHRAVADLLIARGARHHIFSAIAMNLADEVRRIVAADPSALSRRMSRNENHRRPLHFAVDRNRPEMVGLLLELGADPAGTDDGGMSPSAYVTTPNAADRRLLEAMRARGTADLSALVALGDWTAAERLVHADRGAANPGGTAFGALHLMAKRGDATGVRWLLDHGADPNARWPHWDSDVTPLHLAILGDHPDVVRLLLGTGADPRIRDTKHDADARGWAEFFERRAIVALLDQR